MLSYTDLKKGVIFVHDGQPWEVLDSEFLRMQQRKAVMQTKLRNLISGKIVDRNWQASDEFEEASLEKREAVYIFSKQARTPSGGQEYWFHEKGNPAVRFSLTAEVVGSAAKFLKPQTVVTATYFNGRVIKVALPIKMNFEVVEAPPAIRGNTAQGGTKQVILEGGAVISAPLFVNAGDVVRVNTETGEYVERVEKR